MADRKHLAMVCGHCGAACDPGDNYCRRCGRAVPQPVIRLVPSVPQLPLPVVQATVWRGFAAVALGTAVELLRRWARRRLMSRSPHDVAPLAPTSLLADLLERRLAPRPDASARRDGVVEEELHVHYVRAVRPRS